MERYTDFAALAALAAAARCPSAEVVSRPASVARTMPTTQAMPSADMARAFILSARNAGKRANDKGNMVSTGNPADRVADERAAIAALTGGYLVGNGAPAHGTQLDNARAMAQRALRPVAASTAPYSRGGQATVAGYVAGINDAAAAAERQSAVLKGLLRAKLDEAKEALAAGNDKEADRLASEARDLYARIG
jgi:hypothetical protein